MRYLVKEVKKNPATTTSKLRKSLEDAGTRVSRSTVWRARRVPLLTAAMKKKRLQFARQFSHWTGKDWERVRDNILSIIN